GRGRSVSGRGRSIRDRDRSVSGRGSVSDRGRSVSGRIFDQYMATAIVRELETCRRVIAVFKSDGSENFNRVATSVRSRDCERTACVVASDTVVSVGCLGGVRSESDGREVNLITALKALNLRLKMGRIV